MLPPLKVYSAHSKFSMSTQDTFALMERKEPNSPVGFWTTSSIKASAAN